MTTFKATKKISKKMRYWHKNQSNWERVKLPKKYQKMIVQISFLYWIWV